MSIEIITKEDLEDFRQQLLHDLQALFASHIPEKKEWLRGSEVKALLKVSSSTLQNFRISGQLKCKKIGGIYFYRLRDIEAMLKLEE